MCEREIGLQNKLNQEDKKGTGGLKDWQEEKVKSDGKAFLVHPGWKLNHSLKPMAYHKQDGVFFIRHWHKKRGIVPYAHVLSHTSVECTQIHVSWLLFSSRCLHIWNKHKPVNQKGRFSQEIWISIQRRKDFLETESQLSWVWVALKPSYLFVNKLKPEAGVLNVPLSIDIFKFRAQFGMQTNCRILCL